jgi:hypothetical protein
VGRRHIWAALVVACLAAAPTPASAEGYLSDSLGVRRVAMRTVLAHPDDLAALNHNPAGLILSPGTTLYLGHTASLGEMGLRLYDGDGQLGPADEISPDAWHEQLPDLAIAGDFGVPWLRVATGIHLARGRWLEYPDLEETRGYLLSDRSITTAWTTAAAFRISPKFAAGLAFRLLHVQRKWTWRQPSLVLDEEGLLATVEGSGTTWDLDLGFHFRPVPALEIGVAFTTGASVELDGEAANVSTEPPRSQMADDGPMTATFAIPFELRAGARWAFVPRFALALDVRMWHYQVLLEERVELDLAGPDLVVPRKYDQSYAWSAGLSYEPVPELELLVGYEQDFTAAPERTWSLDQPMRDGHTVGIGARWRVIPALRIGLGGARTWYDLVDVQESALDPPLNGKAHGAATEVTVDVQWTL